jgi:hypothetical protein
LEVADRLGRPVAIIRLGGRLPDAGGPEAKFLFGSPPVLVPNSLDLYSDPAATSVEPIPQTAADHEIRREEAKSIVRDTVHAEPGVRLASRRAALATDQAPEDRPKVALGSDAHWQLDKPAPVAVSISDDE